MSFVSAYEKLVACFAGEACAELRSAARAAFEERTGTFAPEDPWFEARSRAFIDDALTDPSVLVELAEGLDDDTRAWSRSFARAHRGLFEISESEGDALVVTDVWSGAAFIVTETDESTGVALEEARGLFDARVVGRKDPPQIGILPGVLFHAEEASEPMQRVLSGARTRGLAGGDTFDALLRMEQKWRRLSRMKPSYAYREEALDPEPATAAGKSRLTKLGPSNHK